VSDEEKIIADVNSSMAMEGMPLTTEDKNRLRIFLSSPDKLENMINELVKNILYLSISVNYHRNRQPQFRKKP